MKKAKKNEPQSVFKKIPVSRSTVFLFIILAIYTIAMLSVIQWGIPGIDNVYPYHMDEWHQFMGVTSLFRHLSNNEPGSSRGPMFFFIQAGIYLGPFVILHIIHPSLLLQHFTPAGLIELHHIFIIIRLYMLLLGLIALVLIYLICKRYLNTNPILGVILLGSTPLWISWSNYFKYDLAVACWIIFSIFCLLSYRNKPTNLRFYLSGVVIGLTIATKISATPLIALYILAFFLFSPKPLKHIACLIIGLVVVCLTFALLGIPDVLFLGRNWGDYITVDLVNRKDSLFGMPWYQFLLFENYPIIFGHGLYFLVLVSAMYYATKIKMLLKKITFTKHNDIIFLATGLLFFCASLVTLEAGARDERLFVVLPFIVLLVTIALTKLVQKNKLLFILLLCIIIAIQLFESYTWIAFKYQTSPRVSSSVWITQHIKPGTEVAIENSPIYQGVPNNLLLDYYHQASKTSKGIYKYETINKSKITAPYAIVTNADYTELSDPNSPKRKLQDQLIHDGYRQIALFQPDLSLYSHFGDARNFYFSGLLPANSIIIYAKKH